MSTLRTSNLIHGSSSINNIVLDTQGRAIFGPNSAQGRASLYVNPQNNRVGINNESPAVALDVDGAINATGNVSFTGNLNIDSGTLFVDSTSNRVGIGTTSPQTQLHVVEDSAVSVITASSNVTTTGLASRFALGNSVGISRFTINMKGGGGEEAYLGSEGNFPIYFQTNGAERLRIDSLGRVGIGAPASTTGANFHIGPASNTVYMTIQDTTGYSEFANSAGDLYITGDRGNVGSKDMIFRVGGTTERMRIDSTGRVGIGEDNPESLLHVNWTDGNPQLTLERSGSATAKYTFGAFSNTFTISSGTTERIRIDSSGNVGINTQNPSQKLQVDGNALLKAANSFIQLENASGTSTGYIQGQANFLVIAGGSGSSNIITFYPANTEALRLDSSGILFSAPTYSDTTANGANVVVGSNGRFSRSTSSLKYKTSIETINDSYSDALLACRPVWYRSTCEADNASFGWWGFIAEEVAEIDPRLVHWKTVEVTYNKKGSTIQTPCDPEPEGVAYDRFVPHLVNLLKRQKEQIETLEQRLSDAGF